MSAGEGGGDLVRFGDAIEGVVTPMQYSHFSKMSCVRRGSGKLDHLTTVEEKVIWTDGGKEKTYSFFACPGDKFVWDKQWFEVLDRFQQMVVKRLYAIDGGAMPA